MNNAQVFVLNAGASVPLCMPASIEHEWIMLSSPPHGDSGWHRDQCIRCKAIVEYDTSD